MPPLALQSQPVIYFAPAYAPHLQLFRCHAQHLDLSREACADFHKRRKTVSCARCPIGAHHAGRRAPAEAAPMNGCARCGRQDGARRLIHGRICVSCFNRQGEVIRGYDRKGNVPRLTLHVADLLIRGAPPAHGFALEHIQDDYWLASCLIADVAELERTLPLILASGTAQVLDSSIGPIRRLSVITKATSSRSENHAWRPPSDQHQNSHRSHANGLHQNSRAARPPASSPA
ncbi:protein of unknown function [Thauera humireducens]|nr:protein of unknown function [Thauera humireducens]